MNVCCSKQHQNTLCVAALVAVVAVVAAGAFAILQMYTALTSNPHLTPPSCTRHLLSPFQPCSSPP